jgi:uncharacterized membrane-anchored protein
MARSREFTHRLFQNDAARGQRPSVRASLTVIGTASLVLWIAIIAAFRLFVQ